MEIARNVFALFGLACFILFILEWASPSPLKRLEGYQPKPRRRVVPADLGGYHRVNDLPPHHDTAGRK